MLIAIDAELLVALQADPVGAGALAAAVAVEGLENPCLLRQSDLRFLYVEELRRGLGLHEVERLASVHALRQRPQDEADRLSGLAVIKGKRLLSRHVKQEVALADRAAEQRLNGVDAAGVVFGDADGLLIVREREIQKLHGVQRRLEADRQPSAFMAVERHDLLPQLLFIHLNFAPSRPDHRAQ